VPPHEGSSGHGKDAQCSKPACSPIGALLIVFLRPSGDDPQRKSNSFVSVLATTRWFRQSHS